ncbi:coproporphyrinogen III oxidase [Streptobacillus moniliformis]|uniref:Coproporphyrinogen dehydrogenase n=2 Tax=Streptobacillus moniliformis TaxID=34105 RepID=D1AVT5_STRM9|nr:coproporphyrinogen III oxidase [Streptobacillus moniliformis]ACZ01845.1 Coproporphyrinogen dehydrogenase [Streptobacillus moniliformis DSM 12112]AVL43161.1 coproporphyrinogen III oxidase [Streptobacillus moniliformis]QXW65177.1 coproporphyrinogen III oxidase [Streptobacillus moniliformis]SQA12954.1 Oxygen-independent coproporphyrinogen-III oxidase 2 [Streptobacillus moniliformis]
MKIISNYEINENKWKEFIYVFFKDNNDEVFIEVKDFGDSIYINAKNDSNIVEYSVLKMIDNQIEVMLKSSLLRLYNINVPWGSLVGVRPTKLVRKLLKNNSFDNILKILQEIYLVSYEKATLLLEVVKNSIDFLDDKTIGIYIGLAFCPTKCTYCSFPAYLKKGKYEKRYDEYFLTLLREIKEIGNLCSELNLEVNSIYVGGGTPSYLTHDELEILLKTINENIETKFLKEYTFEAGRIDTIDNLKLSMLKIYNVTRISINPQSFKDSTLKLVNRYHNLDKLNEVYTEAKKLSLDINMDFIIGLPLESTEDVLNTLEQFRKYNPENVTFHYLAMKKASTLTKNKYFKEDLLNHELITKKISEIMNEKGYIPYYMYRQKSSSISGENIGYCKSGKQLIYNIEMIEEYKSIISIGAGAITKLIKDDLIKRLINPKDPLMWLDEFEDRLNEKKIEIRGFM